MERTDTASEGLGYWNYGFGHFAVLAENLRAQTGGGMDLYQLPGVRKVVEAVSRLEIVEDIYPAFADCSLNTRPDGNLLELLRWRLYGQPFPEGTSEYPPESPLIYYSLTYLAAKKSAKTGHATPAPSLPASTWFPDSGVCIARPGKPGGMSAAWKGGNNAEHHNHNDVGTTVVVWKGHTVLADPGATVYRKENFGKDRYRLPVMSSFGHSVPVVAGSLQAYGPKSIGRVISTDFNDAGATVVVDLASAYPATGLQKLERTWNYQRAGDGVLMVEDRFEFAEPFVLRQRMGGLRRLVSGRQNRSKRQFPDRWRRWRGASGECRVFRTRGMGSPENRKPGQARGQPTRTVAPGSLLRGVHPHDHPPRQQGFIQHSPQTDRRHRARHVGESRTPPAAK